MGVETPCEDNSGITAYPDLDDPRHPDDAVDLLNGNRVVVMHPRPHDPRLGQQIAHYVSQIKQLAERGNVNVDETVRMIERGPFPGFAERVFSERERERFRNAEPALCAKLHDVYWRFGANAMLQGEVRKLDHGMRTQIEPLISSMTNEEVRTSIERGISLWRRNRDRNKHWSMYNRSTVCREGIRNETALPLLCRDLEFFSMELADPYETGNRKGMGAGFNPVGRGMGVFRMNGSELDVVQAGVPLHECIHADQQSRLYAKRGCGDDQKALVETHERFTRHLSPLDGKGWMGGVLEHECEAYAANVELLRARMEGRVPRDVDQAMDELRIPRNANFQRGILGPWIRLSALYFEGGGRQGDSYPSAFRDHILEMYTQDGEDRLLTLDADGFPVPR